MHFLMTQLMCSHLIPIRKDKTRTLTFLLLLYIHKSGEPFLVLLSVFQIRWLLEDEIVSALRHSWVISSATLQKVAKHVLRSSGRPHCRCEDVPLQFVFGPEQSLEKFKEARTHEHAQIKSEKKKLLNLFYHW